MTGTEILTEVAVIRDESVVEILPVVEISVVEIFTDPTPIIVEVITEGPPGTPGATGQSGAGATPLVGFPALRAIPTDGLEVEETGRIVVRLFGSVWSGSGWFLIAGTDPDDNDTILRPDDYAAVTNEKIWVKIWGL